MDKARIYVDLNEMVDYNTVLLSKDDTKIDSEGNVITFYEGMPVSIYSDDASSNGEVDNLIGEGIAIKKDLSRYSGWQHVKWCCRIDLDAINNAKFDLSTADGRIAYLGDVTKAKPGSDIHTANRLAKNAKEVLVEGRIPNEKIGKGGGASEIWRPCNC